MSGSEAQRRRDADAWIAKADNDLLNIENNLGSRVIPWDTVCFHAQQAAEKVLKGFLVYHGRLPARVRMISWRSLRSAQQSRRVWRRSMQNVHC